MNNSEEVAQIVQSLAERTALGELGWVSEEENPTEYTTSTERFTFYVGSRDRDAQAPFTLEVWRKGDDLDLKENVKVLDVVAAGVFGSVAESLSGLYFAARQSSVGLKGSLASEVLKDLGLSDEF